VQSFGTKFRPDVRDRMMLVWVLWTFTAMAFMMLIAVALV
jgi:hypothetical protein